MSDKKIFVDLDTRRDYMKIKDNILFSPQNYVEEVIGKCYILNDLKDIEHTLKANGYMLVYLDIEEFPLSCDSEPIICVSLTNVQKLFENEFCTNKKFVLLEVAKDCDVSCEQELFLCEIPTQKTFTVTIEETISEDFNMKKNQISNALFDYVKENFSFNNYGTCSKIVYDIIKWTICEQQLSEERTIDALDYMLYSLGIDKEEIEKFLKC